MRCRAFSAGFNMPMAYPCCCGENIRTDMDMEMDKKSAFVL